jgi:hypothetical protein
VRGGNTRSLRQTGEPAGQILSVRKETFVDEALAQFLQPCLGRKTRKGRHQVARTKKARGLYCSIIWGAFSRLVPFLDMTALPPRHGAFGAHTRPSADISSSHTLISCSLVSELTFGVSAKFNLALNEVTVELLVSGESHWAGIQKVWRAF